MATNLPARSILKQPTPSPTPTDEAKAAAETHRKNLSIALRHANLIQQRKDLELRIFANIETLLEFPSITPFSPVDATRFVSLIRTFQPSDYDNLIDERRIDGKCGYCLCSKQPRCVSMGASAAWKVKGKGAESYCSDGCARKALYVKTQLSGVPAWEREGGGNPRVVLHPDDRGGAATGSRALVVSGGSDARQELARERGDTRRSFRPKQVMSDVVIESAGSVNAVGDTVDVVNTSHTAIEGYEPGTAIGSYRSRDPNATEARAAIDARDDIVETSQPPNPGDDEDAAWNDFFDNPKQG